MTARSSISRGTGTTSSPSGTLGKFRRRPSATKAFRGTWKALPRFKQPWYEDMYSVYIYTYNCIYIYIYTYTYKCKWYIRDIIYIYYIMIHLYDLIYVCSVDRWVSQRFGMIGYTKTCPKHHLFSLGLYALLPGSILFVIPMFVSSISSWICWNPHHTRLTYLCVPRFLLETTYHVD